MSSQKLEDRLM